MVCPKPSPCVLPSVLEGILLKAEGFQLNLTGYDLEMGIVTTIEANVKEAGEVVLNAKLLSSMISRMPAGQVSILSAENGKTTIQSGVVQFEIQSMPANDFPELPNTGAEETLTIKTGVLKDMIDRTLYAVSQDEKKPAHTGELFEILPDKLTVVALDGYRLAIVERPVTAVKDIRIIVPSKTMTEVAHLLPNDDEEPVHISANRRYVVFMAGGYTIMSRLIEGEFLNYRNVIPADSRTRVTIDTKEFIETIERASLIITERLKNPLRISFTEVESWCAARPTLAAWWTSSTPTARAMKWRSASTTAICWMRCATPAPRRSAWRSAAL
mgnify:FL=1